MGFHKRGIDDDGDYFKCAKIGESELFMDTPFVDTPFGPACPKDKENREMFEKAGTPWKNKGVRRGWTYLRLWIHLPFAAPNARRDAELSKVADDDEHTAQVLSIPKTLWFLGPAIPKSKVLAKFLQEIGEKCGEILA